MHSSTQPEVSAPARDTASLSGLTGADALFETLVDSIVAQLGSAVPGVSAPPLRTLLLAFRPRFEAIYEGVLREHLGTDLPTLVQQLCEPRVRAYFEARRSMGPELSQLLRELRFEMGKTQI